MYRLLLTVCIFFHPWLVNATQFVAIDSRVSGIEIGQILDSSDSISLAKGEYLKLISENGETLELTGPRSGLPGEKPSQGSSGLVATLSDMLKDNARKPALAVFRSASVQEELWEIPIDISGTYCVESTKETFFSRRKKRYFEIWHIRDEATNNEIEILWEQGKSRARWPSALSFTHEQQLAGISPNGDEFQLSLILFKQTVPTTPHLVAALHALGCELQARKLLNNL